jgi:hypothetical protein
MQKLIQALPDALITGGVGAVSYGAWLLHPAAGFITGGVLSVVGGVLASINARGKKAED